MVVDKYQIKDRGFIEISEGYLGHKWFRRLWIELYTAETKILCKQYATVSESTP